MIYSLQDDLLFLCEKADNKNKLVRLLTRLAKA